ncbi:YsnF/AvaK domain-containing protein [Chthonobacter albigriseus]|uniref:YsnF/AvaK domain-containing protein n=1 Tax=Chthonobacter albigriseus TaxID=1683161 RepID=UPI0015EF4B44|nr:YsnF/AvaK domain-containing protein [Chthonobacter albigriseus]
MAYGIDNPTGGTRVVTAYFETRDDASRAVERLVASGIPQSQVRLTEGTSNTASTTATTEPRESRGFLDMLADLFIPDEDRHSYAEGLRRGGYLVSATVDAASYDRAIDILDDEGSIDIGEREQSWRSEGWSGYEEDRSTSYADLNPDANRTYGESTIGSTRSVSSVGDTGYTGRTGMDAAGLEPDYDRTTGYSGRDSDVTGRDTTVSDRDTDLTGRDESIPIVEERLRVGKRDVSHGRVRVRSYVVEEPVSENVTLRNERVDIERRPVDRAATSGDDLFRERTVELEEHSEEAVISKDARVREELRLRKEAGETTETVSDTVRRTEVEVEDTRSDQINPRDRRA